MRKKDNGWGDLVSSYYKSGKIDPDPANFEIWFFDASVTLPPMQFKLV